MLDVVTDEGSQMAMILHLAHRFGISPNEVTRWALLLLMRRHNTASVRPMTRRERASLEAFLKSEEARHG